MKAAKTLCAKCRVNPRTASHSYCLPCKAKVMRDHRAAKQTPMSEEERRKASARSYAHVYLRRGQIERTPCVECGDPNVIMLHKGGEDPKDVVFLCLTHHRAARKAMRQARS